MSEEHKSLTDALIITKRFRSPNEFGMFIDELVQKEKIGYMDAIIKYCEGIDIDVESVGSLINQKLKEKVQIEAEQANLIKPRGHLPI